jgi:hypothetical protein
MRLKGPRAAAAQTADFASFRSAVMPQPPSSTPVDSQPLDTFSNCHVGLLHQLDAFDRLPALLAPAAEARRLAQDLLDSFGPAIHEHHADEERELFPAVISSARSGTELEEVQRLIERLTGEHRDVETRWDRLKPALKAIAKGHDAVLDMAAVARLVEQYRLHAQFEEAQFLPLAHEILGRNGAHMAALGLSLHMRRVLPGVLERFANRI